MTRIIRRCLRAARLAAIALTVLLPTSPQAALVKTIEYVGDHVFLTANPAEIAALDSGSIPGWIRTGVEFWVHDAPEPDLVPVCRFYSTAFAPRSSHFYTADAAECAAVQGNRDWVYEGVAFFARLPGAYGVCPPNAMPVVRWHNGGRGGAPNHIFSPYWQELSWDPMTVEIWDGAGWYVEGDNGIAFCRHESPPDASFDLVKARKGRETLVADSHWQVSLEDGGESAVLFRVSFDSRRVEGHAYDVGRIASITNVGAAFGVGAEYAWRAAEDRRAIDVSSLRRPGYIERGEAYLELISLHYVGRDRMEGFACLVRGGEGHVCMPVAGRRL